MSAKKTPLTSYQIKLFVFLSVATFFEGYDFFALTQILLELSQDMSLDQGEQGTLVSFINLGTMVAFLLVRLADKWGRKKVLTITIAGYTLFTFATAFSPNVYLFAAFQFLARIFLIAEWATCNVYAAEEFPDERRGMVIGVISAFASLGSIVCAGVVPLLLQTEWGWRSVYFVAILPLVILAFARRGLKESKRFEEGAKDAAKERHSFFRILSTPYRNRMLMMGLIWGLTYVCTHNAITFWRNFALQERGLTPADVGIAIPVAAVAAMPLVFLAGKLIDVLGRKKGGVLIYGVAMAGVVLCYTLEGLWPLTAALIFGIFGASAVLPVLNAFNTELFPTELRGDAFAWSNNLIGRIGYVASPALVGVAAKATSWGAAVPWTAVGPLLAIILICVFLPETKGKSLEQTSAL